MSEHRHNDDYTVRSLCILNKTVSLELQSLYCTLITHSHTHTHTHTHLGPILKDHYSVSLSFMVSGSTSSQPNTFPGLLEVTLPLSLPLSSSFYNNVFMMWSVGSHSVYTIHFLSSLTLSLCSTSNGFFPTPNTHA